MEKNDVKSIIITALAITLIIIAGSFVFNVFYNPFSGIENNLEQTQKEETGFQKQEGAETPKEWEIVAENLRVPWEIVFLPNGNILISEWEGVLKMVNTDFYWGNTNIAQRGEGGLLGLALHPDFSENNWIYLYFTTPDEEGIKNMVARYDFKDNKIENGRLILDNIPAASIHNGGRIIFGPDGYLYVTAGDAAEQDLAQDVNSLAGKILRIKDDGSIPEDNPFGNAVFSYGHRNPQGLTFDSNGRLYATEHGQSGHDELNLIEKGKNYGWPVIQGDETRDGMETPIIHSGAMSTWAPAGLVFLNNSLFFGGLKGQALYQVIFNENGEPSIKEHFKNQFGRIRAVVAGPDGYLYISTSNKDGRGKPKEGDDKIIKIDVGQLN